MLTIPGYHVVGLLARGGMAKVYLARHLGNKRRAAIKVYRPRPGGPRLDELFLEEIRILANLHHIHIVSIYDHGTLEGGSLYLVMEYIEGGSLLNRLTHRMDEALALHTLRELAYILQFIHNHGIIHCDIKPDNILFRRDHSLVLTDFGIAKPFMHRGCTEKSVNVVISPDYASPEQIQGLPFDWRTDIYSAGLVFIQMLTGKNPYHGNTLLETMRNHLVMGIPQLNDHFARFQPLVNRMLAPEVEDRFYSMGECIDEINRLLAEMAAEEIPLLADMPAQETQIEDDTESESLQPFSFKTTQLHAAI